MNFEVDDDKFDLLQSVFIGGIIDSIKDEVDELGLSPDKSRELVENLSFAVAAILDGSQEVSYDGVTASPVLTFKGDNNEVICSDGGSYTHEYVSGTIDDIYD